MVNIEAKGRWRVEEVTNSDMTATKPESILFYARALCVCLICSINTGTHYQVGMCELSDGRSSTEISSFDIYDIVLVQKRLIPSADLRLKHRICFKYVVYQWNSTSEFDRKAMRWGPMRTNGIIGNISAWCVEINYVSSGRLAGPKEILRQIVDANCLNHLFKPSMLPSSQLDVSMNFLRYIKFCSWTRCTQTQ